MHLDYYLQLQKIIFISIFFLAYRVTTRVNLIMKHMINLSWPNDSLMYHIFKIRVATSIKNTIFGYRTLNSAMLMKQMVKQLVEC